MSGKNILWFLVIAFVFGAAGSIVFDRYIIPEVADLTGFSGLRKLTTDAPIIINRKEEVQLNEGVNMIALTKQAYTTAVSIYTTKDPKKYLGNGFIVTSDGLIFTSKEVVGTQSEVAVVLNDGAVYTGLVRAMDPKSELAVVTITANDLSLVQFSDAAEMQTGQRVLALGRTDKEFSRKVVSGLVTKTVYNNANSDKVLSTEILEQSIETDAKTSVDYVGGPIFNLTGRVIGMVANSAGKILISESMDTALKSYLESGKIQRPFFGFKYQSISQGTMKLKGFSQAGALAVDLEEGSAKRAGLLKNDLIIKVNNEPVADRSLEQILDKNYLSEIRLEILRDNNTLQLSIKPDIK